MLNGFFYTNRKLLFSRIGAALLALPLVMHSIDGFCTKSDAASGRSTPSVTAQTGLAGILSRIVDRFKDISDNLINDKKTVRNVVARDNVNVGEKQQQDKAAEKISASYDDPYNNALRGNQ
jgi:hypothetical protein